MTSRYLDTAISQPLLEEAGNLIKEVPQQSVAGNQNDGVVGRILCQ
jgi:hypothetical protein